MDLSLLRHLFRCCGFLHHRGNGRFRRINFAYFILSRRLCWLCWFALTTSRREYGGILQAWRSQPVCLHKKIGTGCFLIQDKGKDRLPASLVVVARLEPWFTCHCGKMTIRTCLLESILFLVPYK